MRYNTEIFFYIFFVIELLFVAFIGHISVQDRIIGQIKIPKRSMIHEL